MQLRTIAYTMKNNDTLDQIDQHILAELARDARISVAELSRRVNLSKTPCQARINRLEQAGYILGYRAIIDPERLGRPHVAFVEVKLSDTRNAALAAFNKAVQAIPEIEQAHMIASSFDYLLKVRTQDIAEYREVLGEKISSLPHIAHTSTHVSMEAVKGDAPSLKSKTG
ncbi:winged helix-turn-helix transcriptional regulator [Devosia chinhatensis]|uniref:Winged helix-turn-helix transcriptional regulator n=2 Tax=Devosia aurantiaca TaxID=2714858 RepID=A0A6M1SXK8_9HYPH|nr:winged helix-turn-helix transcriptional regulator [Devosia aurantiaca]NGP19177.1 winged helix-turn-helix transcriptional regulator [Devosia aurantiaca]